MTSISDCVLNCNVAFGKKRGYDSTEKKITYKLLSEKRKKRNGIYNDENEKIHNTYKSVATIIQ